MNGKMTEQLVLTEKETTGMIEMKGEDSVATDLIVLMIDAMIEDSIDVKKTGKTIEIVALKTRIEMGNGDAVIHQIEDRDLATTILNHQLVGDRTIVGMKHQLKNLHKRKLLTRTGTMDRLHKLILKVIRRTMIFGIQIFLPTLEPGKYFFYFMKIFEKFSSVI